MTGYWKIEVLEGTNLIGDALFVSRGQITVKRLEALLETLVAKHGLTDAEIVNCYAKKRAVIKQNLLEVEYDNRAHMFRCGTNPHAIATAIDEVPSSEHNELEASC